VTRKRGDWPRAGAPPPRSAATRRSGNSSARSRSGARSARRLHRILNSDPAGDGATKALIELVDRRSPSSRKAPGRRAGEGQGREARTEKPKAEKPKARSPSGREGQGQGAARRRPRRRSVGTGRRRRAVIGSESLPREGEYAARGKAPHGPFRFFYNRVLLVRVEAVRPVAADPFDSPIRTSYATCLRVMARGSFGPRSIACREARKSSLVLLQPPRPSPAPSLRREAGGVQRADGPLSAVCAGPGAQALDRVTP